METMEMITSTAVAGKPGYKLTRFGLIPEDWEVINLKKCCELIKDGTHFSPVSKDGPRMYITSKNIRNGYLDLRNLSYISEEEHRNIYSRCPVRKGDILLTKDGASTGNVCQNPLEEEFSLLSSVAVIRADEKKAYNSYLLQFLLSPLGVKAVDNEIAGQAITRITLDKIQAIQLPLPSIREQKQITNFLDSVDKSVRLLTELIESKNAYKRGLMQQLLTGQRRFPGFQGQPWREQRISSLITESRIPGSNGKEAKKLTVKLYGKGVLAKSERQVGSENTKYYTRKAGQFIYSKLDFLNGAFGIIPEELDGFESTLDLPTFDINPDTDASFLLSYFSREAFYARFADIAEGGRKAVRIGPEELLKKKILLPSLPEQQRIATVLTACDQEIELLQAQLRQWQQQKKGLMQQLLTGQLRVPTV